jgi:hypothetical protein
MTVRFYTNFSWMAAAKEKCETPPDATDRNRKKSNTGTSLYLV